MRPLVSDEFPHYPADADPSADEVSARRPSWRTYLLIGLAVALVLAMVVLHLAGVLGPAEH